MYQNHSCISSITGAAASAHKQLQRISSISAPGHQQRFKTNWALSDLPGPNLPHPNSSGDQFASARFAAARSAGVQSTEAQFARAQSARGQFARVQSAGAQFAAKSVRGPICRGPIGLEPSAHQQHQHQMLVRYWIYSANNWGYMSIRRCLCALFAMSCKMCFFLSLRAGVQSAEAQFAGTQFAGAQLAISASTASLH